MIKINQVKISVKSSTENLMGKLQKSAAKLLKVREEEILGLEILRRSIDARHRPEIFFSYTISLKLSIKNEENFVKRLKNRDISVFTPVEYRLPALPKEIKGCPSSDFFQVREQRPRVVGFGPAGMFAGLLLARAGLRPIILERGEAVENRVKTVDRLWQSGELNPESNPQFGEGGAGTFSDGKLNTLVKDKEGRGRFVLEEFIRYGASEEILIDAKPHVGTDKLVEIVRGIREEILSLGGEIHFNTKFHYEGKEDYPIILAIGHSSRDSYEELFKSGLLMEAKDFAMGFRVQHPQSMINRALYGDCDEETLKILGPAAYKISHTAESGRGIYSFCMCPGGYVVNSSSEKGRLCVNGMSYSERDSENANAAIIASIRKSDYHGEAHPLNGIALQRELERRAYALGNGKIPMERYGDFRKQVLWEEEKLSKETNSENSDGEENKSTDLSDLKTDKIEENGNSNSNFTRPIFKGDSVEADLTKIFDFSVDSDYSSLNDINLSFLEGMESFQRQIPGFSREDAILAGIEARTSSPVRIPRDGKLRSNIPNIYPCGEGAGYAGGITSAAMDGMKVAEAVILSYAEKDWAERGKE